MDCVWREAELPGGLEGYSQLARLPDGTDVLLVVTSLSLTPRERARVRREHLAAHLRGEADERVEGEPP